MHGADRQGEQMFVFDGEASSERETINRWESLGMNRWGPIIGDRGSEGQKNMGLRRVFLAL